MTPNDLVLEKKREIATLIFNRPHKRNALTYDMWKTIPDLIQEVEEDRSIKVLVVRGVDQTAFAAGADISEFRTLRADSKGAKIYNEATHHAERTIATMTKPSIALVQGYCIGGGCEIALACDFRFSDPTGRFGITPANLGIVYSLTATKQLVDLVGPANAKYILLSGRHIDAQRAYEIGLVNGIFAADEIEEKVYQFAQEICHKAQFSVRSMKHIIGLILGGQTNDNEETEALRNGSFDTEDYQEGVRAFLEKRKPRFTYS
ncbi:enoyl-CoA hydratase/carnithine racemase [Caldalkalibacillus uzonensis]|uniref:Enoyl-CoA hydratase/carnithine racemase n=1 Tax=Caldalkalibacillus uzonensis TaxID=353224 RepID=A0ABU0CNV8_9BACI|nr:enoyl-CoA hydratase-related protein [Caldalkalibacillus uzonensis]MDQ0338096.1 enoyl-CoA hydratase/carnithine racemase [Caldalkalibacillus uzonensis]